MWEHRGIYWCCRRSKLNNIERVPRRFRPRPFARTFETTWIKLLQSLKWIGAHLNPLLVTRPKRTVLGIQSYVSNVSDLNTHLWQYNRNPRLTAFPYALMPYAGQAMPHALLCNIQLDNIMLLHSTPCILHICLRRFFSISDYFQYEAKSQKAKQKGLI